MRIPRIIDALWLFQPGEPAGRPADNVESAILIEIGILEVEPGCPGSVDADRMLAKVQASISGVLKEQQPVLAA